MGEALLLLERDGLLLERDGPVGWLAFNRPAASSPSTSWACPKNQTPGKAAPGAKSRADEAGRRPGPRPGPRPGVGGRRIWR